MFSVLSAALNFCVFLFSHQCVFLLRFKFQIIVLLTDMRTSGDSVTGFVLYYI